jgi:hypothetical protein
VKDIVVQIIKRYLCSNHYKHCKNCECKSSELKVKDIVV